MNISQFKSTIKKVINAGLSESEANAEVEYAIAAIGMSQRLQECSLESIGDAILAVVNCGLSLNPVKKQAYLEAKSKKTQGGWVKVCQWNAYYGGLVDLIIAQGKITKINTQIVYENDVFELNLADDSNPISRHSPPREGKRGNMQLVYSIATFADGTKQVERMSIEEINKVRESSEGYKAYKASKIKDTPWHSSYGEMARKTNIKRFYKYIPKGTTRTVLDEVIARDNEQYGISIRQETYILDLVETANIGEKMKEKIRLNVSEYSYERAFKCIQYLNENQISKHVRDTGGMGNKGDINDSVKESVERDNT